ncbi:MAG: DoxX family protein [Nannocystaceae bacterium]|nr:DoxX family protein [Nannocystaceae bacterium]
MKPSKLRFWIPMGLFATAMAAGGVGDLVHAPAMVESMSHLGYPLNLATLLGIWKLLGVGALLLPGRERLKEWAYAGFAFDLTGAAFSHAAVGHGVAEIMTPLVLLALGAATWSMTSARRRFAVTEK